MKYADSKFMEILLILFFLFLYNSIELSSQIVINEVQNQNTTTLFDEEGDTPDWIELYNSGNKPINLNEYSISDKISIPKQWIFPNITLEPGNYLLILASGKNRKDLTSGFKNQSSGFGNWRYKDDFGFHYKEMQSDFDFFFQISFAELKNENAEAGLMLREDLNERSRYTGLFFSNKSKFYVHINPSINPDADQKWFKKWDIDQLLEFPNVWARLKKVGDSISVYFSENGNYWHFSTKFFFKTKEKFYLGIAHSSGNIHYPANIFVKNINLNGYNLKLQDFQTIDFDKSNTQNIHSYFHTNFSLKKDGDSLFFFNNYSKLISQLSIPYLKGDISFGLNSSNEYRYFEKPTPELINEGNFLDISPIPNVNKESGFYSGSIKIGFEKISEETIYYTTDCTLPDSTKIKWNGEEIQIDSTTIIRAVSYTENAIPSEIITKSFLIENNSKIPVMSVVSAPDNLFSDSLGILVMGNKADPSYPYLGANFLQRWEIPGEISYFEPSNNLLFESKCGITLQGGGSRYLDQKPLKLISRKRYEDEFFVFPFFKNSNLASYKRLLMRTCSDDWYLTMLKDPFSNILMNYLKIPEHSNYSPIKTYLNGKFWGIYNFQDRIDIDYIRKKYQLNAENINILEFSGYPINGNNSSYFSLIDKLKKYDYQDSNIVKLLDNSINIENFIDYLFIQVYTSNTDWPQNNMRIWNSDSLKNKWEWIAYDFDFTFCNANLYSDFFTILDTNTKLNNETYNVFQSFFKYFLHNETLKQRMFSRIQDLLNYNFRPENTLEILNNLLSQKQSLIPQQISRWPNSLQNYNQNIEDLKLYVTKRPQAILMNSANFYFSKGLANLQIKANIPNACKFDVNSNLDIQGIAGLFFREIPVTVKVKPNEGYKFVGWSSNIYSGDCITFYPDTDNLELTAYFEKIEEEVIQSIVINEIMYKSPDDRDTKDWIELYNNGNAIVDLKDWIITDSDDSHIFAFENKTELKPGEYLAVINDKSEFSKYYPDISNFIGSFNFGLGRGDAVRIYNPKNELIDIVEYGISNPWPNGPDGSGASLELISPLLDNNIASSWKSSVIDLGTPGKVNSTFVVSVYESIQSRNNDFMIFPNPATDFIQIAKSRSDIKIKKIDIFDILNNKIVEMKVSKDSEQFSVDVSHFSAGIYLINLIYTENADKFTTTSIKFVKN